MSRIQLAGIEQQSITDGPGLRFAIFTQGCPHECKGCHNPETWPYKGGEEHEPEELLAMFDKNPLLKGATLSGGEPLVQAKALIPFAKGIRERGKDIVCFTGYIFEDLLEMQKKDDAIEELLRYVDILIDGRFILEEKDLTLLFRGSQNQRLLDLPASLKASKAVMWENS